MKMPRQNQIDLVKLTVKLQEWQRQRFAASLS